jgi:hypothetical protein
MIEGMKLKRVSMSIMKMKGNIDKKNKAVYDKVKTANFNVPGDFYDYLTKDETEELTTGLLNGMYEDLIKEATYNEIDSLGLWVEYDGKIFENAIKLQTLKDINKLGAEDIEEVYEFFKMTVNEVYYPASLTNEIEE